jgi:hypothetical protein
MSSEVAKTFDYTSKFYINTENDKKPTKFTTNLKIILFDLESR